MKNFSFFVLTLLLLACVYCCKKTNSDSSNNGNNNNNNQNNQPAKPTSVGTPTGAKTSKLIPKSGGSIISDDGLVELVFPNGALTNDDTITIQPITNNCPGGTGTAYRLGPEGLKFDQAVTLKFHYSDSVLQSTLSQFMLIAFQDSTGIWFVNDSVSNDTTQHVISAKIHHFSDWTQAEDVAITPNSATLKKGESITLSIINYAVSDNGLSQETIARSGGYALLKGNSTTWAVNGVTNGNSEVGTITVNPAVSPLYDFVKYTAPNTAPSADKNPVLVSAEFNQKIAVEDGNGSITGANKVILYAHIYIVDGGYHVKLTFEADSVNQAYALWNMKDQGSFDVVLSGTSGSVRNIQNSDINIGLASNNSTCNSSVDYTGPGTINIVDSSNVLVNPLANNINIIFNSLDQKNYVKAPIWSYSCPGNNNGQIGGGSAPPFPAYIQFNITDSTQTFISGQYTIEVTPIK
ncbi:MAG: hypothetical protein JST75_08490 [Bacteroidetes bacterium]|nr:hypothetical protein [Bacteroidota bacterium]